MFISETNSTNTLLQEQYSDSPNLFTIRTDFQTAGRGQQGNGWESERGANLLFSTLLRTPDVPVSGQFCISMAVSVALCDAICRVAGELRNPLSIKWPNDIYAGDRKICGTLIETGLADKRVSWAVAGIGLNVNQQAFDPSLPNPTSMTLETGRNFQIEDELPVLVQCILDRYDKLDSPYARHGFDALYLEHLYRRGEWHFFEELQPNEIPAEHRSGLRIEARILGIDPEARLLLEHRDGTLRSYGFKEIKYVR